ncbi:MAG: hypothetical protein WKH64_06740 [Chloroflexia bacterium]
MFGVAAALVGVWLRDMPSSVIMRSSDEVLDQVRRTLDLMSVGYNPTATPSGYAAPARSSAYNRSVRSHSLRFR